MAESVESLQIPPTNFINSVHGQNLIFMSIKPKKKMVFSKVATSKKDFFYYKGEVIKKVQEFKYLGIVLSNTKAKMHLCEQAQKAICGVIRKN